MARKKLSMSSIANYFGRHSEDQADWCHVCGERKQELAELSYPKNAEHFLLYGGKVKQERIGSVRICVSCINLLMLAAKSESTVCFVCQYKGKKRGKHGSLKGVIIGYLSQWVDLYEDRREEQPQ